MKPGNSSTSSSPGAIKVAHIASGDLWAGAEVQLFTLAVQLQKKVNVSLQVCLLNYGHLYDKLVDAGIAVSVFDECKLSTLQIGIKLYRTLKQFEPDVIHTHRLKENIVGSIVALLLGSTASIRTVHGALEQQAGLLKPHKRLQYFIDYLCGRYFQKAIVAVSSDLAEQLSVSLPVRKIRTIFNGIDSKAIEAIAARPISVSQCSAIRSSESVVKICFAGRLAPVKRLDLWLQTAAILANSGDHQFSFYIIGDGPEKTHLITLTNELQLADSVHFMGEQKNVPALLKQMDILLLTSDHEGLPMVILEALCLKIPVVAHAVGGISALLEYGKAGYLVTRHASDGYAQEILSIVQDPSEADRKSQIGLLQVNSAYAARACAEQYLAAYKALSQQRSSPQYH